MVCLLEINNMPRTETFTVGYPCFAALRLFQKTYTSVPAKKIIRWSQGNL
jgi:hypothetical protein